MSDYIPDFPDRAAGPVQRLTFLHTSDLQLGMTRWFLEGEAQARFENARIEAIERLGEVAADYGCSFIVVAGDVFEYNTLSKRVSGRALEALRQLPVPVYLLPGNHDPLTADSIFYSFDGEPGTEGITLLADSTPHEVTAVGPDGAPVPAELVGAPLLSKHPTTDLVGAALDTLEPTSRIRVLVGHGQPASYSGGLEVDLIDLARVEAALADATIDYLALGDTHSTTPVGSSGRVWYSGAPEVTDFREVGEGDGTGGEANSGNALVVTVTKPVPPPGQAPRPATVAAKEVRIGAWRFEAISAWLNSGSDVDAFLERLRGYPNKDKTAIKYSLTGTLKIAEMRELEAGIEKLREVFAALYRRERTFDLHLAPTTDEIEDAGFTGFYAAALDELIERGEEDAVALMFRLASAQKER